MSCRPNLPVFIPFLPAVFLSAWLFSACVPVQANILPTDTARPESTATRTATATATIDWFPATATPTPYPTAVISPTADLRPTLGAILLEDNFGNADDWQLKQTTEGSVALGKNELTIVISHPGASFTSIRQQPFLANFYLEMTANPSLCRDLDEYGLLVRVSGDASYYRFSLSCNGQVRLDRLSNGEASSPQPWVLSGAVPPGAPSLSTLAVAAEGNEMRFFVNDQYQFTVRDPLFPEGRIGIFARSAGENSVTVNFSNLTIWEIQP